MAAAFAKMKETWEEIMAGELHEISEAIGALKKGQEMLMLEQQNFLLLLNEKDERDEKSHADTQKKVDAMYKAYIMGGGIFWLMAFGGILLALVELYDKARALFQTPVSGG